MYREAINTIPPLQNEFEVLPFTLSGHTRLGIPPELPGPGSEGVRFGRQSSYWTQVYTKSPHHNVIINTA